MKPANGHILLMAVIVIMQSYGYAQTSPVISFITRTFDYGTISEAHGKQKCTFNFVNDGKADLIITEVKPGCGCTTSSFTEGPVKPGQRGQITVEFDPAGMHGPFNKSISVGSNDPEHPVLVLFIKGIVTPRPGQVTDTFRMSQGNLYFINNHVALGEVSRNETLTGSIPVYNHSSRPMRCSFTQLPAFIEARVHPDTLQAFGKGVVQLSYNADLRDDWGLVFDRISLQTDDTLQPEKWIIASANIVEDFRKLSRRDSLMAPRIKISGTDIVFDTVVAGNPVSHNLELYNQGKSKLLIHKISSNCPCILVECDTQEVQPGEEIKIMITFDTAGLTGVQHKVVTIIANDPQQPVSSVAIRGYIRH